MNIVRYLRDACEIFVGHCKIFVGSSNYILVLCDLGWFCTCFVEFLATHFVCCKHLASISKIPNFKCSILNQLYTCFRWFIVILQHVYWSFLAIFLISPTSDKFGHCKIFTRWVKDLCNIQKVAKNSLKHVYNHPISHKTSI